jgi:hypothetical protein
MTFNPTLHEDVRVAVEALMTSVDSTLVAAIAAAVDGTPIVQIYDGTQWPVRKSTSGTNRPIFWGGPSTASLPNTGTTSGGTRAAAPGDWKFLS